MRVNNPGLVHWGTRSYGLCRRWIKTQFSMVWRLGNICRSVNLYTTLEWEEKHKYTHKHFSLCWPEYFSVEWGLKFFCNEIYTYICSIILYDSKSILSFSAKTCKILYKESDNQLILISKLEIVQHVKCLLLTFLFH